MSKQAAVFMVFIALGLSTGRVHAIVVDEWVPFTQPDGTTFTAHIVSDEVSGSMFTGDGYAFVYNDTDGYSYYAELDAQGNYRASAAKVGIDDPATYGIPKNLQRSAARKAAIQAERIARGFISDPNSQVVGTSHSPSDYYSCTVTDPCTAYVVMLSFADRTTDSTPDANDRYSGYDVPWGYSWDLFNQFFNGGYDLDDDGPDPEIDPYTGTIEHPATGHTTENLEVFGSLRAYFHEVIGQDVVRFEILNRENPGNSQPVWIQLPRTKRDYAEDVSVGHNDFFAHAEQVTQNHFGTSLPANFPLMRSADSIKQRNKVIYLYAGVTVSNQSSRRPTPTNYVSDSGLHPQVNVTTRSGTGNIGYQYMMGERQGWPLIINEWNAGRPSDRFSGIGMHVHEWGHLFGLQHPVADWTGMNPYTSQTVTVSQANTLGWGSMHTGAQGPPIQGTNGWTLAFRSCPNPYNPFSRWELGWNTVTTINQTAINQRINPGPANFYVVEGQNGHDYILDFRTNSNFGQYNGWYRFNSSVGLLIWRRERGLHLGLPQNPMLIPADGRSIFDARARPVQGEPTPENPNLAYTYVWQDRLSDPFGARPRAERTSDPQSSQVMDYGDPVLQATDATHLLHETTTNPRAGVIGDSHLAFLNIRNEGAHALVDIYLNYWSGSITGSTTWSGTVYVGGDMTITSGATLTITDGTEVRFLAHTDDTDSGADSGLSELIVEGMLNVGAGSITFDSASADPSSGDWYGIRVRSGGTANLQDATIRDGLHCVQNEGGTLTGTPDCGLTITSDRTAPFSLDEDVSADPASRTTVATYRVEDLGGTAVSSVTWSLAGDDETSFLIEDGVLIFNRVLDFERLTDEGAVNDHIDYQVRVQAAVGPMLEQEVTVTVRNVDEVGVVTVEPTTLRADGTTSPPRQGEPLTATLTDPDREESMEAWTWERQMGEDDWVEVATFSGSTSSTYEPQVEDVGQLLQVRVSYQDGEGTAEKNAAAQTESVVGVPGEPELSEPVVVAGQVTLTWQEPSSTGGLPILRYEYQQSDDGGQMWPAEGEDTDVDCQAATCSQELALAPGLYAFGVRAVNAVGFSHWVRTGSIRISALMVASQGSNPELAFAEVVLGQTRSLVVETYTASGVAAGTTVGWSLAGADMGAFTIDGGVLSFAMGPDYEAPTDANHATDEDGNNIYHVTVQATAAGQTAALAVAVTVTNADDPGEVTLSSTQPQVDEPIQATLSDQDGGIVIDRWSWERFPEPFGTRSSGVANSVYTPAAGEIGQYVRVTVSYRDEHGAGKQAQSVQTEPIVGPPGVPRVLTARAGNGQVTLRWRRPLSDGGRPITGYEYHYIEGADASVVWPAADQALAVSCTAQTCSQVVGSLTNGTTYTLAVRAVNGVGAGAAATTTARPERPDRRGQVTLAPARPRVGEWVEATLSDPDAPVRIIGWRWQHRSGRLRSDSDSSSPSVESRSPFSSLPNSNSYLVPSTLVNGNLQAEVQYRDGHSTQVKTARSRWVPMRANVPTAPVLSEPVAGDGQVALRWTAAEGRGAAVTGYQYRRSDQSAWLDVPGGGLDLHYTVGGLANGTAYTFKVRGVNREGRGGASNGVVATPISPNRPPVVTGPVAVSFAEGDTGTVGSYAATDPDADALTWSLTGADAGVFRLDGTDMTRDLSFVSVPDFETASQSRYAVAVVVSDGSLSSQVEVEVEVTNVEEAGVVGLSSTQPEVGVPLRATLTDPDGQVEDVRWSWLYFSSEDSRSDSDGTEVASTAEFTPSRVLAGVRLQARALYADRQGPGKSAESALTDPVVAVNRHDPELVGSAMVSVAENQAGTTALGTYTTSDGDGDEVTLSLTATDGGPFRLSSAGVLQVTAALDYEHKASYALVLSATDNGTPSRTSTRPVTMEVTNEDEAGTVSLTSSSPRVGDRLTASLADPDGYQSGGQWQWLQFHGGRDNDDDSWSEDESTRSYTADSYTVPASAVGRRLRARISNYTDGHGSGKTAHSALTAVVQPSNRYAPEITSPNSVSMAEGSTGTLGTYTTSDGDGDGVTLSLTATDGGSFSLSSAGALDLTSALDFESDRTSYTVTLTATDHGTPSKSSTKTVSVSITNEDEAGTVSLSESSLRVGDQITATLTDPDGGLRYATTTWAFNDVSRTDEASDDATRSTRVTSYRYTVQASDEGRRIRVSASYTDGHGAGKSASTTSGVVQPRPNRAPTTPSGASSVSVAENTTSVGSYTATDPDGDGLTWSVDNSAFSIAGGALRFRSAPNYESDARSYSVGISVSDGSLTSGTKTVSVSVTNQDEAGTVSLTSSSPRVGDRLTASLADPDGYQSGGQWQWLQYRGRSTDDDDAWEEDESRASDEAWVEEASVRYAASSYTVRSSDVGRRLRARISRYTDGQGAGKSAHSSLTATVRANVPGTPPNFSAEEGDIYTRVDLSWSAAATNGAAITRYEYRYKKRAGGSWSSWTSVGLATRVTVSDLSSGQRYDFEVRAVNDQGAGTASATDSLVRSPSAKPVSLQAMPDTLLSAVVAPTRSIPARPYMCICPCRV